MVNCTIYIEIVNFKEVLKMARLTAVKRIEKKKTDNYRTQMVSYNTGIVSRLACGHDIFVR